MCSNFIIYLKIFLTYIQKINKKKKIINVLEQGGISLPNLFQPRQISDFIRLVISKKYIEKCNKE